MNQPKHNIGDPIVYFPRGTEIERHGEFVADLGNGMAEIRVGGMIQHAKIRDVYESELPDGTWRNDNPWVGDECQ